jgi:hypothetical protein
MADQNVNATEVDQFIVDHIDTVPQLEALLLLWNSRPRVWVLHDLAKALYISTDETKAIVDPLVRRGYVCTGTADDYSFCSGTHDALIAAVNDTYRRELIRISRMIHSKASPSVREFARAFLFKKEKD